MEQSHTATASQRRFRLSSRARRQLLQKKCAIGRKTSADWPFSFLTPLPFLAHLLRRTTFVLICCGESCRQISFWHRQAEDLASYAPSIVLGAAILFLILFGTGAYDSRVLLRFRRSFFLLLKSVLIWFIAFAGVSFILEFDAHLSRVYHDNFLRPAGGLSWLFSLYRPADRREIRRHRGPAATNSLCRLDCQNGADRSSCDERPLEPL